MSSYAPSVSFKPAAVRKGRGILNTLIDNLPFEAHIPSYR